MSRQRQLAREARQVARAAELEQATRARARQRRRAAVLTRLARRPVRRRRYGALPLRVRLALLAGWVAAQALLWQFVHAAGQRLGLAVLTGACLLVVTRPSLRGPR